MEANIQATGPLQIPNYNPYLSAPPTGSILTNTSGTTPVGYLLCDGSEVSRTTYNALFMAIGTYYGDGNGSTTFNLPNLVPDTTNCVVTYIIKT
jgi:microcystin-dependent protein